ncbi:MAG: fibronectin type III domain-containing protein [Candidatus Thermoplasmatota archaeon]|nr:fibronectin type III domain-containing protein [Candidatus Thermoplasmatota archaeon]
MKKDFFRYSIVNAVKIDSEQHCQEIKHSTSSGEFHTNKIIARPKNLRKKIAIAGVLILFGVTFYFLVMPHLSDFELPFFKEPDDAPISLKAITASNSSIRLEWQKRWDADSSRGNYIVYTLVKRKEGTYPESISDPGGITVYNGTDDYTVDTNLQPGTIYCYRAWHFKEKGDKNSCSNNYAQAFNLTKPQAPQSFVAQSVDENQIQLRWKKGQNDQYTYIVRKEGSMPENMNDGHIISNLTGESFTDLLPEAGKIYCYKAWNYVTKMNITCCSDDFSFAANLTKPEAPKVFMAETHGESKIELSWDNGDGGEKTIIIRKEGSMPENMNDGTVIYNGTGTYFADNNRRAGHLYYYKAWHFLKSGGFSQYSQAYSVSSALTKPYCPVSFHAKSYDNNQIKLYWQNGVGSDTIYIVRKEGSTPENMNDGVIVYEGSDERFIDRNVIKGTTYYYRAWNCAKEAQFRQFSDECASSIASPNAPAYNVIESFVERDKTDENEYNSGYVCHNFSVDVIKNADKENIHAGYVYLDTSPGDHAIVAVNTSDRGLIFLEPQLDVLFTKQKMDDMLANERYHLEKTWQEGNIIYTEYFDIPLYGYEITWDYLYN